MDILLPVKTIKDFTVESCSTNLYVHVNNNDKDLLFPCFFCISAVRGKI